MSALMDQVAELIARQRAQQTDTDRQALAAAYKHQPEPFEAEFAQLASDHPEACGRTTISHHLRVAMLLDAAISQGGEWTTRRVQRFYRAAGIPAPRQGTARRDLHALHMQGYLALHEEDAGRRFYTVNTRKDTTA
ncbi:hypothetical protein [Streptomyces sp. NPDC091383]|uniref:hypothetical protein n=1 Tax=Streptomyces sp. NPDC091383 TaxID=3365996 RepID=UPI00382D0EFC